MDDERKGRSWIAWCSAIIVLLGLYVGMYAALVKPMPRFGFFQFGGPLAEPTLQKLSGYRVDHRFVFSIFSPMERVDRRVRTDFWDEKEINADLRETAQAIRKQRIENAERFSKAMQE